MLQSTGSRWLAGSGTSRAGAHRAAARLLPPPWACAQEGRGSESSRTHRDSAPGTAGRIRAGAGAGAEAPRRAAGGEPCAGAGAEPQRRRQEAPARVGGAEHCGRHSTARLPRTVKRRGKRGAGARCVRARGPLASRRGREARSPPSRPWRLAPPRPAASPRDAHSRTRAPPPPPAGLSQMSVISFHTRPLFRQQPVL